MKNILVLFALLLVLIITSCDLFYIGPYGRENPIDYEAQIGRFAAAPSGSNSVMVVWDWRDPWPGTSSDREIEEIQIAYRKNGYPITRVGGDRFSITDGSSLAFTNLDRDDDHNFALYAKEKSGTWLAPIYASAHLEDSMTLVTGQIATLPNYLYAAHPNNFLNDFPPILSVSSTAWVIHTYEISGSNIGSINNGNIDISIAAGATAGDVWIVPLRWRVFDGATWDTVDNTFTLDMNNAVKFFVNSSAAIETYNILINDVLNLAYLNGSNTIALISDSDTGAFFELNSISIYYDYWGNL